MVTVFKDSAATHVLTPAWSPVNLLGSGSHPRSSPVSSRLCPHPLGLGPFGISQGSTTSFQTNSRSFAATTPPSAPTSPASQRPCLPVSASRLHRLEEAVQAPLSSGSWLVYPNLFFAWRGDGSGPRSSSAPQMASSPGSLPRSGYTSGANRNHVYETRPLSCLLEKLMTEKPAGR